jgi:CheY-like chemotaxis protein
MRELCKAAFATANIPVILAENGREAVRLALSKHPSVILMDIMMPVMNGHEAVKKIREDDWGRTAKIIYLTNFSEPENVYKAIKSGPEDFVIKAHTSIKDIVNKARIAMHTE